MNFLIGLDIGTSSVKGILISEDGTERNTAKSDFAYQYTENGGVEIEAEEYVSVCCTVLRRLSAALPESGQICGISAASASGNLLLLDEYGKPSTPIFNWQDSRVANEAEKLLKNLDKDKFYGDNGWPFSGREMPLALLCWIKKHQPEKLNNCGKICMSTEYLFYRLTGQWGIGTSTGTPFYLIDQRKGIYNKPLLDVLGISEDKLPPIMKTGAKLGAVTSDGFELCALKIGTPVVLGTFDHPCAARAVGVLNEGQLLLSCGTSWVGFYPIKSREKAIRNGLLVDPFLSRDGCWGTMFSLSSISCKIEAYIRKYITDSGDIFKEFSLLAEESSPGAGGLVINPTAVPDDEKIRQFSKPHIARALMEGVVYLLKEQLDLLRQNGIAADSAVMTGGPTQSKLWVKMIEDITGLSVRVMHGTYAGAVGAAMLAGIAAGLYKNEESAFKSLEV